MRKVILGFWIVLVSCVLIIGCGKAELEKTQAELQKTQAELQKTQTELDNLSIKQLVILWDKTLSDIINRQSQADMTTPEKTILSYWERDKAIESTNEEIRLNYPITSSWISSHLFRTVDAVGKSTSKLLSSLEKEKERHKSYEKIGRVIEQVMQRTNDSFFVFTKEPRLITDTYYAGVCRYLLTQENKMWKIDQIQYKCDCPSGYSKGCNGTGQCQECAGSGKEKTLKDRNCIWCDGTGKCRYCKGEGWIDQ
jgi:hypothetical protein